MNTIKKLSVVILLMGFLFGTTRLFAQISHTNEPKSQILILGSYHMNNPGQDVYNLKADDVLSKKRQQEIQQLVDMLAAFKPTKIAVERRWQTKYDTMTQEQYAGYLKGSFELTRSEDKQIGFRLAKQLGHKQIYCIDAPGNFEFNKMIAYANENGQGAFFKEVNERMQGFMKDEAEFLSNNSIKEMLKRHNKPAFLKEGHAMYIGMLQIGKNKDYPGADLVSDWYERNMRIFSNLTRITEPSGDRVLVIFGSGHAPILRELVQYYPHYELVEMEKYVK